ncbi:FecR domain-containing protein [Parabacteroides sp. OttesenSCG-928-N08]|nr:FecR domain-containing protein [Parabacteroides sp. OttesenSCG-928-N08]
MKKRAGHYTNKELLENDSFLRWKLLHIQEDSEYWESYLQDNPEMRPVTEEAGEIVASIIRLNDYRLTEEESLSISLAIQKRLLKRRRRKQVYLLFASSAVAACLLGLFFLSYPLIEEDTAAPQPVITEAISEIAIEECKEIQMIIGNEESLRLEQDADIKYDEAGNIVIFSEHKEVTKIENKEKTSQKDQTNKLIVPKGKRSSLVLADGTKIWINSGSTVEFPHTFEADKREITVDGEIYIEVAKDPERPFFVNTSQVSIEVLGTRFNVSSYLEDRFSHIVLVEGKVEVGYKNETFTLAPDELATIEGKKVEIKHVNVYNYISWKDGLLQFNSEPLANIAKRLSRYFDIEIRCDDNVRDMACSGKLVLFEDINQVMKTITNTIPVKYEVISDNEIIISKK